MARSFTEEIASKVAPARFFQAGVIDLQKIIPLVMPDKVLGVTITEGDGGVGTVLQFNYTQALPYDYIKERIDVLDKQNFEYKYTQFEGGYVGKKIASAIYHFKLVPKVDGGSVCSLTVEYTALPGLEVAEEDINVDKEAILGIFKAVEEYLLANPQAYA